MNPNPTQSPLTRTYWTNQARTWDEKAQQADRFAARCEVEDDTDEVFWRSQKKWAADQADLCRALADAADANEYEPLQVAA